MHITFILRVFLSDCKRGVAISFCSCYNVPVAKDDTAFSGLYFSRIQTARARQGCLYPRGTGRPEKPLAFTSSCEGVLGVMLRK